MSKGALFVAGLVALLMICAAFQIGFSYGMSSGPDHAFIRANHKTRSYDVACVPDNDPRLGQYQVKRQGGWEEICQRNRTGMSGLLK